MKSAVRSTLAAVASVCLAGATLVGGGIASAETNAPTPTPRIVGGGSVSSVDPYPWITYLSGNGGACTGELVKPQWVLSAAHCAQGGLNRARIGSLDSQSGGDLRSIDRTKIHPNYGGDSRSGGAYDIALFHLTSASNKTPAGPASTTATGKSARVLGWGETQNGQPSRYLKAATETIISPSASCRQAGIDSSVELCLQPQDGGVCRGDSGGPAAINENGVWKLAGTTSRGADGNCNNDAVFENVSTSQLKDWISQNAN